MSEDNETTPRDEKLAESDVVEFITESDISSERAESVSDRSREPSIQSKRAMKQAHRTQLELGTFLGKQSTKELRRHKNHKNVQRDGKGEDDRINELYSQSSERYPSPPRWDRILRSNPNCDPLSNSADCVKGIGLYSRDLVKATGRGRRGRHHRKLYKNFHIRDNRYRLQRLRHIHYHRHHSAQHNHHHHHHHLHRPKNPHHYERDHTKRKVIKTKHHGSHSGFIILGLC